MTGKVLVAYASKYGSTAEIAQKIGHIITRHDLEVELREAADVDDVSSYHAVILGSAVYAGMWRKEAVELLEREEKDLAQRPLWLFSSGPTGEGDPVAIMDGWRFPEGQQDLADRIGVRDIAFFHGKIDPEALNLGERLIVKALKAQVGDYRDWTAIETWAAEIAEALTTSHHQDRSK